MEITIDFLIRYANECFYSGKNLQARPLKFMLEEISKVIDISDIKIVYPKNLFIDDKQVELYLFNEKRQIMKVTYEDKEINTILYFLKDIVCLENKVNAEKRSRSLLIKFSNSEMIEFNNKNDTNSHYNDRFETLMIDITKLFTTSKKMTEQ